MSTSDLRHRLAALDAARAGPDADAETEALAELEAAVRAHFAGSDADLALSLARGEEVRELRAEVDRLRVAIDRLIRAGSDVVAADADGELTDDDIIDLETAIDAARGVKS